MEAAVILLDAMTQRGHAPLPPRRTGCAIRTECKRCGFAGVAYADGAGEYIADSVQGEAVTVTCPSQRRLSESPSSP